MRIERAELRQVELPLVFPFETSFGREETKSCVLVRLYAGGLEGWGEAPAAGAPLYTKNGLNDGPNTRGFGAPYDAVIDATNLYGVRPPEGFASNAEFVKSKTNGPTAKSFNINFASLYGPVLTTGEALALFVETPTGAPA